MTPPFSHQSAIEYVMSLTPTGMREGRENVVKLMEILGNPQDTLQVFHVTGSNGKGSVCQMISQVLWKSLWKKVGLFISPHIIDINERFQINGQSIASGVLEEYYQKVLALSKKHSIEISSFEIQVIVMVLYFVDEEVDYAVVEVGLGGTYDGTNIFAHPLACFITSIALEHTHVLGKSRQSIVKNKLGIVKKGSHLYIPLKNKLIEITVKKVWAHLHTVRMPKKEITNLPGKHQQRNAEMVLECLVNVGFEKKAILQGLMTIENPGRFEWIKPNILVDTANNRENIRILAKMIRELPKAEKTITLFGTTQIDSLYAAELAQMVPCDERILVDDFCERALPCSQYSSWVRHNKIIHFSKENKEIEKTLADNTNRIIIYWSIYFLSEIINMSSKKAFASR